MSVDARISTSLPSHPKTKKLIRRIGEAGAWNMICLFLWTAANRSDGDLSGMTDEDIELAAGWSGGEGAFVAALVAVKFLDGDADGHSIHDWAEHNPWAAGSKRRSEVAKANAAKKWGGAEEAEQTNAQKRSARLAEARRKGTHSPAEWEAMKDVCGNACLECGTTELDLSKDHILAVCKGGSDAIDNIQPLCHRCNARKGANGPDLRPPNWSQMLAERLQNACGTSADSYGTSAPSPSPSPSPSLEEQGAPADAEAPPTATETIPFAGIVAAYNATMTNLPKVRETTAARKTAVRSAWQESKARQSLEFWTAYFEECADDAFLNGTGPYSEPHANWRPDFDFLLKKKTIVKVYERAMDRMERAA